MIIKLTSIYNDELYVNTSHILYWRKLKLEGSNALGSRIFFTTGDMTDVKHSPEEIRSMIPREG
jgi:hypothetical protein